jgi:hypothetical protein
MISCDRDGRIVFGRFPIARPRPLQPMNQTSDASTVFTPPHCLHQLFQPGSRDYHVARLLQRVQEVRSLVQEDLQEIVEPLRTLADKAALLSREQQVQQRAAEEDYQQAVQVIDQALARLLRHFPAEMAVLQQAGLGEKDMACSGSGRG